MLPDGEPAGERGRESAALLYAQTAGWNKRGDRDRDGGSAEFHGGLLRKIKMPGTREASKSIGRTKTGKSLRGENADALEARS